MAAKGMTPIRSNLSNFEQLPGVYFEPSLPEETVNAVMRAFQTIEPTVKVATDPDTSLPPGKYHFQIKSVTPPAPEWVTDKPPADVGPYLVTLENISLKRRKTCRAWWTGASWGSYNWRIWTVIAWKPMPEPME